MGHLTRSGEGVGKLLFGGAEIEVADKDLR